MTNREKYEEVFGFDADVSSCPTSCCKYCPIEKECKENIDKAKASWWENEYKQTSSDTKKLGGE